MKAIVGQNYINWYASDVVPEHQKIDKTIESAKSFDKEKLSKIEQHAIYLENVLPDEIIKAGFDCGGALSILDLQEVEKETNE